MKKLVELNLEIEKIIFPKVTYNVPLNNFSLNDTWVSDTNTEYFDFKKEIIINMINSIEYKNNAEIIFLKHIDKEINSFLDKINKIDLRKLSFIIELDKYSEIKNSYKEFEKGPINKCSDINLLNSVKNNLNTFVDAITDCLMDLYDYGELDSYDAYECGFSDREYVESFIKEDNNLSDEAMAQAYAKAFLCVIYEFHIKMVKEISTYIKNFLALINKLESFEKNEAIINSNIQLNSNPNELKLEFDLTKKNVGYLFNNLYEIGIIAKDKTDVKDERTKLKNYIDSANIHYRDYSSYPIVDKINKAINWDNKIDSKEVSGELVFIESLISKLNLRTSSLKEILEKLKKKGL